VGSCWLTPTPHPPSQPPTAVKAGLKTRPTNTCLDFRVAHHRTANLQMLTLTCQGEGDTCIRCLLLEKTTGRDPVFDLSSLSL